MNMIMRTIIKGMWRQCVVVGAVLFLLTGAGATLQEECRARWDCPCAGGTKRLLRHHKRSQLLARTAHNARRMTEQLLRKMVEDRFKNNTDHTEALRECALARDPICLGVHLHQCNLHTLPQMGERLDSTSHKLLQLSEAQVLREARHLLASLAIFMEQARRDELLRQHAAGTSYFRDILAVENKGIYHLLCNLQRAYLTRSDLTWQGHSTADADFIPKCRFTEFAPSDNRNYIVLYTLENALNNIAHQMTWLQRLGR